jgi:tricarboxylate carrier
MSAFVPMNVAIIAGMLQARNIAPTVFWQSVNQTYNVCLNYSNGNNRVPPKELGMSYIGALVTSVGTAVGLNEWIKRATFTPAMKNILLGLVPLTAVSAANVFNISFMRMNEITHGITVKDEEGNAVGTSKIAGKKAVFTTIVSRVALVAPGMILPNFVMDFLEKKKAFVKYPWMRTPVYLTTIAVIIGIALPLCIGLFPQTAEVPVTKLEPEFHDLKNSRGEKIEKLYFNKGL